jgi:hypothetical protein
LCTSRGKVTRPKQPTEQDKIFASCTSDKVLTPRIYRQLKKINLQTINNPVNMWANELNRRVLKEAQMTNKYI